MKTHKRAVFASGVIAGVASVALLLGQDGGGSHHAPDIGPHPKLPAPQAAETIKFSTAGSWPAGKTPSAPAGFGVQRFGDNLVNPRWVYVLPNGDVLVAEASTMRKPEKDETTKQQNELLRQAGNIRNNKNRISLLRDENHDGVVESQTVLRDGLNQPFGMLYLNGKLYVANTDSVLQFDFKPGQTTLTGAGKKIATLPAGGYNNHWTRNLSANPAGTKLYVTVGSASNVAEHGIPEEHRRANILEMNPDGTGERIYASGLRNPNGIDWQGNVLWTVVNERDNIGDDLPPDYITSVRESAFYGWPYSYWGPHVDSRVKPQRSDLVQKAIAPDFAVGAHTASLGLAFYRGNAFPAKYRDGAFIGQHGSWNRSAFSGFKVIFVPFRNGRPEMPVEDFLTGFLKDPATGQTHGRPVGIAVDPAGALLVADDTGDSVWRVTYSK